MHYHLSALRPRVYHQAVALLVNSRILSNLFCNSHNPSHQRHIFEAGFAYCIDLTVPDGVMNVSVLQAAGYVSEDLCECPSSPVADFDDYNIDWSNGVPEDVDCTYRPAEHDWEN